jgi:hypothetical protein
VRSLAIGLAATIALSAPLAALAQRGGGGGGHAAPVGGGGGHAAPARASAPQPRPAAQSGGFDLHEDISAPPRPATPARISAPVSSNRSVNVAHAPTTANRPAPIGNLGYGGQPGNHRVVADPRYHGAPWGWNRGVTWNPAPNYWGGGFWGPFALGAAAAALFGSIYYNDETLASYQVEPDSPGAQLLANYQLTQVPCGPPDLVVIFGLDNSVICAEPNDLVAAGEYQLDPSQLTIVSLD